MILDGTPVRVPAPGPSALQVLAGRQGDKGDTGDQGPQGLPGVNAVENDTAIAAYINDADSATASALNIRVGITPDQYGAAGDGTTDDTVAFQAALNAAAGGILRVPARTYRLGQVTVPADTRVVGAGRASVLKALDGLDGDLLTNADQTNGDPGITISDLTVDGNKATMTSAAIARGIYLVKCPRVHLARLYVHDTEGHGIHLSNSGATADEGQTVSDVVVEACGSSPTNSQGSGFAVTNAGGLTLTNTHAYDNAKAGFRLGGHTVTLNGCVSKRNGNGGVVPVSNSMTGLTINGGHFADNGPAGDNEGIRLMGCKNVTISGATCSGNAGAGIGVYTASTDITITGVQCRNNGLAGGAPPVIEGRDGITVEGDTSDVSGITINGVRCFDDQTTKTQQYGLRIKGRSDHIAIGTSDLRGNLTSGLHRNPTVGDAIVVGRDVLGLALSTVNNSPASVTGTTTATVLRSVTIPGGQMGRRGGIRVRCAGGVTGTAGSKTLRFKFGTFEPIAVSMASAATADWLIEAEVWNLAAGTQRILVRAMEGTTVDVLSTSNASIDTTAAVEVGVTVTLGQVADTVTADMFVVEPA